MFGLFWTPVNRSQDIGDARIAASQRILLVVLATGLISLLVVAAWLPPDPRGYGTHQQLGLPPCSFQQLTGWRCPSCGMTTSWSHLVRGQIAASFRANSGGALLGLVCLVVAPWALMCGLRGRWLFKPPGPSVAMALALTVTGVTLADWLIRCLIVGS